MVNYDELSHMIRRYIYVQTYERYHNDMNNTVLERIVAKHPLMKPEIIVVNDQPYGFKPLSKHAQKFENYPIFIEMEYGNVDGTLTVMNMDLYSEIHFPVKMRMSNLLQVAKSHANFVVCEYVKRLNNPDYQCLLVYSKVGDAVMDGYFDDCEADDDDAVVLALGDDDQLARIENQISNFIQFINILDAEIAPAPCKIASDWG